MFTILVLVYITACLLIAYVGRNRKFGFWGFLFCSIFLTPITGFVAFLASCEKVNIIVKHDNIDIK